MEEGMETFSNILAPLSMENPMDRGAWWATSRSVTTSQTRLKWLSTHADIITGYEAQDGALSRSLQEVLVGVCLCACVCVCVHPPVSIHREVG